MKAPIFVICLFCVVAATGQPNSAIPKNIRAANTLETLLDANGLTTTDNLYGIPLEPGMTIGNAYLNPDWRRATFLLYDDKMIEGYPSRYEIDQDQFEIRSASGIKVLSGKRVKSFVWLDSLSKSPNYFVNGRDFRNSENTPLSGFYEVLAEGPFTLLSKTELVVKKPNYNEKLDVGSRDHRIVKKAAYAFAENGKIYELPTSRKKFFAVFGEHADAIQEFARVNARSLDEREHLKAIFEEYNKSMAIH